MSDGMSIESLCEDVCDRIFAAESVNIEAMARNEAELDALRLAKQRAERLVARRRQGSPGRWVSVGSWQPGEILESRYEVIRTLGIGGMGEVYLLKNLGDGKTYAAKRVRSNTGGQLDILSATTGINMGQLLLLQEILRSMRVGSHPNVLRCKFFDAIEGGLVLFSRHLHGGSIEEALKHGTLYQKPVPPHVRWLSVVLQVLDGLAHLHRHGVIHQDIKPSNVLIARCGRETRVRICDFGIARETQRDESGHLAPVGVAGLDPKYASPEQSAGKPVNDRTDLYSWSRLAVATIPGIKAPDIPAPTATLTESQIHQLMPREMDQTVRRDIAARLAAAMQQSPDQRPSAESLIADIRDWYALPAGVTASLAPPYRKSSPSVDAACDLLDELPVQSMDMAPQPPAAERTPSLPAAKAAPPREDFYMMKPGSRIHRELLAGVSGDPYGKLAQLMRSATYESLSLSERRELARMRLVMMLRQIVGNDVEVERMAADADRLLTGRGANGMREIVEKLSRTLRG